MLEKDQKGVWNWEPSFIRKSVQKQYEIMTFIIIKGAGGVSDLGMVIIEFSTVLDRGVGLALFFEMS